MTDSSLNIHKELPIRMNMHFFLPWWPPMNPKSQVGASNAHVQSYKLWQEQCEGQELDNLIIYWKEISIFRAEFN